jgi:hypothetical protein
MVWMFTSRNQAILGDNGSKYQYGDLWQISFEKDLKNQGIPQQPSTGQIASLILVDHHCWFSGYSTHFQVGGSNPKVEGQEFF